MYRDSAPSLDERDHAVGSILIGESLIGGCERAAVRLREAKLHEPWRAVSEAQLFGDVWRHLDRAQRVLAARGINTAGYDEIRPRAKPTVIVQREDGTPTIDAEALDDARRAIEELKLVVPGADWIEIEKRTAKLVELPILGHKRKHRLVVGGVVGAFILAVGAWTTAIVPQRKPDPRAEMRAELADIVAARRDRIASLELELGQRCEPQLARQLAERLVMDGRTDIVRAFSDAYATRCGVDPIVSKWARAPRPRARLR